MGAVNHTHKHVEWECIRLLVSTSMWEVGIQLVRYTVRGRYYLARVLGTIHTGCGIHTNVGRNIRAPDN